MTAPQGPANDRGTPDKGVSSRRDTGPAQEDQEGAEIRPLIVACVLVQGNVPYTPEYVVRLRSMVKRNLARPFKFVCVTDNPNFVALDVHKLVIRHDKKVPGWWAKMELFNPAHKLLQGPGIYLDLDTLIVKSLDPIADFRARTAFVPHAGTFEGRDGLQVIKRYNSSVMKLDFGSYGWLYGRYNVGVRRRLWGDQDFIGEQMPDEAKFPLEWFPRLSELNGFPPKDEARVVLCKRPKNSVAAERLPWVRQVWQ